MVKGKCTLLFQNGIFHFFLHVHLLIKFSSLFYPKCLILSAPVYSHCHQSGTGPCHPNIHITEKTLTHPSLTLVSAVLQFILHTALQLSQHLFCCITSMPKDLEWVFSIYQIKSELLCPTRSLGLDSFNILFIL